MFGLAKSAHLTNPFRAREEKRFEIPGEIVREPGIYQAALKACWELQQRPQGAPVAAIERQHQKNRMTVWERIRLLVDEEPTILFQNWGPNLDGASLVTALAKVGGRDVAIYGHDFRMGAHALAGTNGV